MRVFILPYCPHCKRARDYIEELKKEDVKYSNIDFDFIDESIEVDLANRFDYYYVPSFFDGDKKLHEGTINKEQLKKMLDKYLGG